MHFSCAHLQVWIEMIAEILRCFTSAYISPLWLQTSKSVIAYITDFSFCRISGVDASGRAQQTVLVASLLRNSLCKHLSNHFLMLQALVVAPNKQKTSLSKPCGRAYMPYAQGFESTNVLFFLREIDDVIPVPCHPLSSLVIPSLVISRFYRLIH